MQGGSGVLGDVVGAPPDDEIRLRGHFLQEVKLHSHDGGVLAGLPSKIGPHDQPQGEAQQRQLQPQEFHLGYTPSHVLGQGNGEAQ